MSRQAGRTALFTPAGLRYDAELPTARTPLAVKFLGDSLERVVVRLENTPWNQPAAELVFLHTQVSIGEGPMYAL